MQRYLSSEQWRKRPNKLEGEVPQEGHSLLCSDCGFFCPEAPATEKRRRKEAAAPPAVGTRGREEPRERTLKRKEEQVLDSKSGAVHSGIVYPCPCPCHFSLGGSLGPQGTEFSHCGALISASRSDGTWDKASPVLPGNGNGNCPAGRRQPLVAMTTSSWASKQIEPTDLACYIPHRWRECCWVTERLWVYPHWFRWWASRMSGTEQGGGDWTAPHPDLLLSFISTFQGISRRRSSKPEHPGG